MSRTKPIPFWYEDVVEAKRSYPDINSFLQPFVSNKHRGNTMDALKALNEEVLKEASEGKGKPLYPSWERRIIALVRVYADIALYEAVLERQKSSIEGRTKMKLYELEVETLKVEKALSELAFGSTFKDEASENMLLLENVRRQAIEPLLRRNRSTASHKKDGGTQEVPKAPTKMIGEVLLLENAVLPQREKHKSKQNNPITPRLEDWDIR
ncbi:MAG: hypothetical protein ACP5MZ_00805 [Candidatus Micrarchaeia archaeon]